MGAHWWGVGALAQQVWPLRKQVRKRALPAGCPWPSPNFATDPPLPLPCQAGTWPWASGLWAWVVCDSLPREQHRGPRPLAKMRLSSRVGPRPGASDYQEPVWAAAWPGWPFAHPPLPQGVPGRWAPAHRPHPGGARAKYATARSKHSNRPRDWAKEGKGPAGPGPGGLAPLAPGAGSAGQPQPLLRGRSAPGAQGVPGEGRRRAAPGRPQANTCTAPRPAAQGRSPRP